MYLTVSQHNNEQQHACSTLQDNSTMQTAGSMALAQAQTTTTNVYLTISGTTLI
jgi:hypothetical protein